MIPRTKNKKKTTCVCENCSYTVPINHTTVKEKEYANGITATYLDCPVCGNKILKQLDTKDTLALAERGVKLQVMQKESDKLSNAQKKRISKHVSTIEKRLLSLRNQLKKRFWNEIYQSLNSEEDTKTGEADQEPNLGE